MNERLSSRFACETRRKVARRWSWMAAPAVMALVVAAGPDARRVRAASQPHAGETARPATEAGEPSPGAHQSPSGEPHGATTEHGSSAWTIIARLVNFSVLAGALVYLLRSPFMRYITDRVATIRKDLSAARDMQAAASAQLAEIDRKLKALPEEIETLRTRGAEEIEAEEIRIQQAADTERRRLLEQARREIELQLQVAKRELRRHAAELAVGVATDRIARVITDEDQVRLVDRYVDQVKRVED